MITFELKLSMNQIACLQAVQEAQELNGSWATARDISYFVSGVRCLINEKLVKWHSPEEVKATGCKAYELTEKGKLVLRVIELDVADYAADIESRKQAFLKVEVPAKELRDAPDSAGAGSDGFALLTIHKETKRHG